MIHWILSGLIGSEKAPSVDTLMGREAKADDYLASESEFCAALDKINGPKVTWDA